MLYKLVESSTEVRLLQVTKLIQQNVIDARHRGLHQGEVQQDSAAPSATASTTDHLSDVNSRSGDTQRLSRV